MNGSLVNPKDFRKQSAVVWQSDVLLPTATVRPPLGANTRLEFAVHKRVHHAAANYLTYRRACDALQQCLAELCQTP